MPLHDKRETFLPYSCNRHRMQLRTDLVIFMSTANKKLKEIGCNGHTHRQSALLFELLDSVHVCMCHCT